MAKKPDDTPTVAATPPPPDDDLITVHGGEAGLPPGLMLSGPMLARRDAQGHLRLVGLPPALDMRYYPAAPPAVPAQASSPEES